MSGNKAITLSGFDAANPTSTMQVSDLPIPSPAANEVVVNVTLRPVNPADIFSLMGVYPGFQPKEGTTPIPGVEGMGTVHAVGEGVTKYSVGQRVAGAPFSSVSSGIGSWQQYIAVTEDCLVAIPDSVSDDAAAQLFVSPCTVVGFFQELQIPAGEYFLQTAAGSVLGRQLIQVAKHKGIKTINVVRRAEQAEELKALGADEVVVSTEEDIPARVAEITGGKGAYAAVECVGGELFASAASAVRNGGTILMYGATSGLSPTCEFICAFNLIMYYA